MHQTSRRLLPSTLMPAPARPGRCSSRRLSYRSAASNESTSSVNAGAAPVSNSSSFTLTNSSIDSCGPARNKEPEATPVRRPESTRNSPVKSVDLAAYYTFTKRNSTIVHDLSPGLSGFLEYRKLNGTWRPFLFQTIGHQLVLYRVHSTHQVLVMSTDIRCASEIALEYDGVSDRENTRLLRLGINGTTITLRAVTHRAAMYWVDGLQRLRDGKPLQIVSDPPCTESEDEIFDEIDKILSLREWTPPPPPPPLCGLCISTRTPEPPTAGMLLKTKKKNEGPSTGCKIC
ncbi:hypothetical protein, variant 3 [Phytophthora nicotianae P10297]|uniref:PH domain-containing protein n=5 Tax=Phytophthora nicotianae TaxID=4792 RepID=V9FVK4_PHYNI|nr:hypothetical protein, variant 1 [Phytophthora nicotianae INRA-310]XP_008899433.1 hypothetical protein, variant 2 [Phytophthora nicotianae INRA-310]XP_008899434.1 hypothetical protein, variant 3 [Phytophthora nicotianae INRA-310]ETI55101.1 hypothetical protein, variant 1 [Phytophthora nicotianae P1569]ETM54606.1 hypothetical protein, variant 1 [Phytophthora nicotianae]ETO83843.1 hypothetical protein, variant 1 [Phytophthora nicotianae P1976]ETP52905.1 hypothetical protein, variant 1 [Phytop